MLSSQSYIHGPRILPRTRTWASGLGCWCAVVLLSAGFHGGCGERMDGGQAQPEANHGPRDRELCYGRAHMGPDGSSRVVEYRVTKEQDTGAIALTLSIPSAQAKPRTWRYEPEVGQEQFISICPKYVGGDLGTVLASDWTYGAGSIRMLIIRMDPQGRISRAFGGVSRFGFDLLDVTGDGCPDVVGWYGDLGPAKKTAVLYEWSDGAYEETARFSVTRLRQYNIRDIP